MSFGKDPRNAAGIIPFGGTIAQREQFRREQAQKSREQSRGGGSTFWKDQFRLPVKQRRWGRFVPGDYSWTLIGVNGEPITHREQFYIYQDHFNAYVRTSGDKTILCPMDPGADYQTKVSHCLGCKISLEDKEKELRSRTHYGFNWLDIGRWMKVPSTDGSGKPITSKRNNQQYFDWTPVPDDMPNPQGYEEITGGRIVPWSISWTQYGKLNSYIEMSLSNDCATCGTQGSIQFVRFVCGNPECNCVLADASNCTPEIREKMKTGAQMCPRCGLQTFAREIVNCPNCNHLSSQSQQVFEPRRVDIFDAWLEVTGVQDVGAKGVEIQILNRQPGPMPQGTYNHLKPYDFVSQLKPTPLNEQSKKWGIDPNAPAGLVPPPPPPAVTPVSVTMQATAPNPAAPPPPPAAPFVSGPPGMPGVPGLPGRLPTTPAAPPGMGYPFPPNMKR